MRAKRKVKARKWFADGEWMKGNRLLKAVQSESVFGADAKAIFVLPADAASYDAIREMFAEEAALEIATAFVRGQMNTVVVTDKREDYQLADKLLAKLGIVRPADRPAEPRK